MVIRSVIKTEFYHTFSSIPSGIFLLVCDVCVFVYLCACVWFHPWWNPLSSSSPFTSSHWVAGVMQAGSGLIIRPHPFLFLFSFFLTPRPFPNTTVTRDTDWLTHIHNPHTRNRTHTRIMSRKRPHWRGRHRLLSSTKTEKKEKKQNTT